MYWPIDHGYNSEGFTIEDDGHGTGWINGVHEPDIAGGIPETQPERAGVAKDIEVDIVLAPTIWRHDMYSTWKFDVVHKPNQLPAKALADPYQLMAI